MQFRIHGNDKTKTTLENLRGTNKVRTIKVYEPHKDDTQEYTAFKFNDLMNQIYGDSWLATEEVLFTCQDGYKASVPVAQFKAYDAYLSIGFANNDVKFELINKLHQNQLTPLGPFYLVWDNLNDPEFKKEAGRGWPYQIVAIDLIEFSQRFPKLAPRKVRMTDAERRGFLAYRRQCLSCHTINGEGGDMAGIELNKPVNVTEYWRNDWLIRWMLNPAAIRPKTKMIPISGGSQKQRQTDAEDILRYLRLMSHHKL